MPLTKKQKIISLIIIIVIAIAAYLIYQQIPGKYDDFAKCLTEKGAKMYGTYWCPHCLNQKKSFGKSWEYINYIECATTSGEQTEACIKAGIEGYPTWEFSDNSRNAGAMSFLELSQKTGCALPK